MKCNLHIHSMFSDGTQWPEEIVARASAFGLEAISISDHDSMECVDRFLKACSFFNLRGIPAVEIDCQDNEVKYYSEILGYFPNGNYGSTKDFLSNILKIREAKMKGYIKKAKDVFNCRDLDFNALKQFKLGFIKESINSLQLSYNKPDLFNYLICSDLISSCTPYLEFKKEYFTNNILCSDKNFKPYLTDMVGLINTDGGFAVLPHPGRMFHDDFDLIKQNEKDVNRLFNYCKSIGVWGIELYWYGNHENTVSINDIFKFYAQKAGLNTTFGSDCHGRGSKKDTLEKFSGNILSFS